MLNILKFGRQHEWKLTLLEDDLKIKDKTQLKLISIKSWIEHPMIKSLSRLSQLSLSLAQLNPSLFNITIITLVFRRNIFYSKVSSFSFQQIYPYIHSQLFQLEMKLVEGK
jgi:hypothetical protein